MTARHEDGASLPGFALGEYTLRPFGGDKLMAVRVEGPAGASAPAHAHPHEQMSLVVSGRVRFTIGGEIVEVGPGGLVHIPSGVEHTAEALEESLFYDIFHPVRDDFLERVGR